MHLIGKLTVVRFSFPCRMCRPTPLIISLPAVLYFWRIVLSVSWKPPSFHASATLYSSFLERGFHFLAASITFFLVLSLGSLFILSSSSFNCLSISLSLFFSSLAAIYSCIPSKPLFKVTWLTSITSLDRNFLVRGSLKYGYEELNYQKYNLTRWLSIERIPDNYTFVIIFFVNFIAILNLKEILPSP